MCWIGDGKWSTELKQYATDHGMANVRTIQKKVQGKNIRVWAAVRKATLYEAEESAEESAEEESHKRQRLL